MAPSLSANVISVTISMCIRILSFRKGRPERVFRMSRSPWSGREREDVHIPFSASQIVGRGFLVTCSVRVCGERSPYRVRAFPVHLRCVTRTFDKCQKSHIHIDAPNVCGKIPTHIHACIQEPALKSRYDDRESSLSVSSRNRSPRGASYKRESR